MTTTLLIVLLAGAAFYLGWRRALAKSDGSIAHLHSKPGHYAWYVALLCAGPALALLAGLAAVRRSGAALDGRQPAAAGVAEQSPAMLELLLRRRAPHGGRSAAEHASRTTRCARRPICGASSTASRTVAFMAGALALAGAGIAIGLGRIERDFRARNRGRAVGLDRAAADRGGLDHDHRRDRVLGAVRIGPLLRARADRRTSCSAWSGARRPRSAPTRSARRAASAPCRCSPARC